MLCDRAYLNLIQISTVSSTQLHKTLTSFKCTSEILFSSDSFLSSAPRGHLTHSNGVDMSYLVGCPHSCGLRHPFPGVDTSVHPDGRTLVSSSAELVKQHNAPIIKDEDEICERKRR